MLYELAQPDTVTIRSCNPGDLLDAMAYSFCCCRFDIILYYLVLFGIRRSLKCINIVLQL